MSPSQSIPHRSARHFPHSSAGSVFYRSPSSCSHIPSGHSFRLEMPSLIPFLLLVPRSDMLVLPVWDGLLDKAWHGAHLSSSHDSKLFWAGPLPIPSVHPRPPGPGYQHSSRNRAKNRESYPEGQMQWLNIHLASCPLTPDVFGSSSPQVNP